MTLAASVLATPPPRCVVRFRRPTFAEQQALCFVGACVLFGGMAGAVWMAARGGLR